MGNSLKIINIYILFNTILTPSNFTQTRVFNESIIPDRHSSGRVFFMHKLLTGNKKEKISKLNFCKSFIRQLKLIQQKIYNTLYELSFVIFITVTKSK
jgi:hypothetical protein